MRRYVRVIIGNLAIFYCGFTSHAQSISIDNAAFPTGIYGQNSTIAVPVTMTGCFGYNNVVRLYLCRPGNPGGVQIGTFSQNGFFTTFINGRIPNGTAARTDYYVEVRTTAPVLTSNASPTFQIKTVAAPAAFVNTTSLQRRLIDSLYYGYCSGSSPGTRSLTLINQSSAGSATTINYKDGTSGAVTNLSLPIGTAKDVDLGVTYYTLTCKAEKNGVISTRAFFLVNTTHNLSLQTSGEQKACLPDLLQFSVNTTGTTGIATNFPGSYYLFTWGDGSPTDTVTYCQLLATGGVVSHVYNMVSCNHRATVGGTTYENAFPVDIKYINPFKSSPANPNNCDEPSIATFARIFRRPQANFTNPGFACLSSSVTFTNTTIPGIAQNGNTCTSDEDYEWFIDGSFVSNDRNLVHTFTAVGTHSIRLRVTNASCNPSEITKNICIEPVPAPAFKMNGKDSLSACAPLPFPVTNQTNTNQCRSNAWKWQVYNDSTGALVSPGGGVYTISPNDTTFQPSFTFLMPGRYRVRLLVTNSCGDFFIDKIVHVIGSASVSFPGDKAYCGAGKVIDFGTDAAHRPVYNSSGSSETYQWSVTGGNYSFVGGTTAADRYPRIQFTDEGDYVVTLKFTNSCGQRTASQRITFSTPNSVILAKDIVNICYDATSVQLTGTVTGPVDSVKWSTTGSGSFSPADNATTTYTINKADKDNGSFYLILKAYARRPGGCPDNSDSVLVKVSPENAGQDSTVILCSGSMLNYIPLSSVSGSSFTWTSTVTVGSVTGNSASGSGPVKDLLVNTDPANDGQVNYTIMPAEGSCTGKPYTLTAIIRPRPSLTVKIAGDTICSSTAIDIQLSSSASNPQYSWLSTVTGGTATGNTSLSGQAANSIQDVLINTGTSNATVLYKIFALAGGLCPGDTQSVRVIVRPGATLASAGADQVLCNETATQLTGNNPVSGSGMWTQINGPSIVFSDPAGSTTDVSGLTPGNSYRFVWNIASPWAGCNGSSDTVMVTVYPSLTNSLQQSPQSICAGQTITFRTPPPTGGNGTYQFSWEQSTDGTSFTPVPGADSQNLSVSPPVTTWYRRVITSVPCSSISDTVMVTVAQGISNNTISADQSICMNTLAATITGSLPAGGNNGFQYSWETSTDGINWTPVTGVVTQDYNPGLLTQTTYFRRLVSTSLCAGPFASISNMVTITVNPDAKALFDPLQTTGCIPFNITPAVINLTAFNDRNGEYRWYVNDSLLGTGENFPGYVMQNDGDSITIKLVTTSKFGCLADSMQKGFVTLSTPHPSFTRDISSGCGPLNVTFTNTTPDFSRYQFVWDFGNGATSSQAQPGTIQFLSAPSFNDTTYTVVLKGISPCDTISFSQVITVKSRPRALFSPDISEGCSPLPVIFYNTSKGLNNQYSWDFGDNSPLLNTDSIRVHHTYHVGVKDTFQVVLSATNQCGIDSQAYLVVVSPNTIRLDVAINGNDRYGCVPHTVQFINNSSGANSYTFNFDDNTSATTTKGIDTITHTFFQAGDYRITVAATNNCSDTSDFELVTVQPVPEVNFTAAPTETCFNDSVYFINKSDTGINYQWDFGDGTQSAAVNPVKSYPLPGMYQVQLVGSKIYATGNACSDTAYQNINIEGATGNLQYNSGYLCNNEQLRMEVMAVNAIRYRFFFGDGDSVETTNNIAYHQYRKPGYYVPYVYLLTNNCKTIIIPGDTVKADQIKAGFTVHQSTTCGSTTIQYLDTSYAFFGVREWSWDFGDGTGSSARNPQKTYDQSGNFVVRLAVTGVSGCTDTFYYPLYVKVNNYPSVNILADTLACTNNALSLTALVQSADSIAAWEWDFGNGITGDGSPASVTYYNPGVYTISFVGRTSFGCADTAYHTIRVRQSPVVTTGPDERICKGQQVALQVAGADTYTWLPVSGLSCTGCSNPVASPDQTTTYIVTGLNGAGCRARDSVTVEVVQPVEVTIAGRDTICIGESTQLVASGADSYVWTPAIGMSDATSPAPVVSPLYTLTYQVTGQDAYHCFSDTASVTVAVGPYPTVDLGTGGTVVAGTRISFDPVITNGPVIRYTWTPATDLSCAGCPKPIATINNNITYKLEVENLYHCKASDTISYTVFCDDAQVFIPNAFSPDGDGVNDILMVRGSGISEVIYFRVFDRWGRMVFESNKIHPNDRSQGWDGRVNGILARPDVYVYTAKVRCTAGSEFIYKGNVTLIR